MKYTPLPLALFLLAGCAVQQPPKPIKVEPEPIFYRYPMPENAAHLAQSFVSHDIKDPDSAKFRDTFFASRDARGEARDKTKDSWCVEMNGKNSYGAYVGYAWALVPAGGTSVFMGANPLGNLATQICGSAKYPPT
ncbi:hypothetical protein [Pseudomonas sp. IT-P291]|uniref:hypothetical protein n=1 Tax=Pseudomonas sp. IT-P291 TaxID=3026448 RepID=UPI0039E1A269